MRYLIETNNENAAAWGSTLQRAQDRGELTILEKGNPVDIIKKELLKISKAFETLTKAGIDEDVMVAYLKSKGLSLTLIKNVLYNQKEFFRKLGLL